MQYIIFSRLTPFCDRSSLEASHSMNERDMIKRYSERVINVEKGSFTPLMFTSE